MSVPTPFFRNLLGLRDPGILRSLQLFGEKTYLILRSAFKDPVFDGTVTIRVPSDGTPAIKFESGPLQMPPPWQVARGTVDNRRQSDVPPNMNQNPPNYDDPPVVILGPDGNKFQFTPEGLQPVDPGTNLPKAPEASGGGGGLEITTISSGSGTTYTGADGATLTLPNAVTGASIPSGTTVLYTTISGTNYITNIPTWL